MLVPGGWGGALVRHPKHVFFHQHLNKMAAENVKMSIADVWQVVNPLWKSLVDKGETGEYESTYQRLCRIRESHKMKQQLALKDSRRNTPLALTDGDQSQAIAIPPPPPPLKNLEVAAYVSSNPDISALAVYKAAQGDARLQVANLPMRPTAMIFAPRLRATIY